ncbi:MAG: V-type ATP synthase subunit I [Treponema sp.]|jgi:V/A-type H+-transporting ATPase subunit I|nr:V-type ATP synthase subunit I [Treponema sp.]
MKKISLFVQDKHQQEALIKLRETGVMHIKKTNAVSDRLAKALERKTMAENAVSLIQAYKSPKVTVRETGPSSRRISDRIGCEEDEPYSLDAVNTPERPHLIDLMVGMGKERKALEDRQTALAKERGRIAAWGEFNPASVKELSSLGQTVYLYELTNEAFAALGPELRYVKLSGDKNGVRLLVLDNEIPDTTPFQLPEQSLSAVNAELDEIQSKQKTLEARIKSFADRRPALMKELKAIQTVIDFESARAELEKVEGVPDAFGFSCLSGFVPAEDMGRLKAAASENSWALAADDPGPDDNVPTKLKNNPLVRLINPLTDFLEVTPGYHEADISGFFLFFFVIFFGMIFGDAGYGAIVLASALFGIFKTLKKGVPPILNLMLLLGISNFLWGVLTCSWFGIPVEQLPVALTNLSFAPISGSNPNGGFVQQNLMLICFTLAVLQLSIGHLVAISRLRTLKILGELGSIAMLIGMYGVVLMLIAKIDFGQMETCVYLLGAGFLVNFIFIHYEGSIGASILESLKNIISMILGIANVFSDIMSYIRLWAVGLAGGAIASTVVTMAGPMLGKFYLFIFGIILLVFGHGLNLILNVLSVLVHGVRLNTLEFSGHVGLTWAGTPYRPFAENKK